MGYLGPNPFGIFRDIGHHVYFPQRRSLPRRYEQILGTQRQCFRIHRKYPCLPQRSIQRSRCLLLDRGPGNRQEPDLAENTSRPSRKIQVLCFRSRMRVGEQKPEFGIRRRALLVHQRPKNGTHIKYFQPLYRGNRNILRRNRIDRRPPSRREEHCHLGNYCPDPTGILR